MLKLKAYQQRSVEELKNFLINASILKGERGIRLAYIDQVGDEGKQYKSIVGIEQSPYICVKIPTGGGKTLVACHMLSVILENYLEYKNGKGLVLWFVPSDAIRVQTLKNLQDRNHPYREVLDAKFGSNIKVFTIEDALSIQKSDLQNNLSIVVSSLQAFRRTDKSWLKVFQNNGSLLSHFENLVEDTSFLTKDQANEIIYSLGNVIKINNPIVILDEGHNVQTKLSYDLLVDLNPSFILEFTATPRSESNVLINVLASELKAEKMVKIPIYLANVTQWQEAIRDGVDQIKQLDKMAINEKKLTKEYIRPIALIQAEQEKVAEGKIYIDKVKLFLMEELKIPEQEIAIKTATKDQIEGLDLLSPSCNIRYILTVNALKEGWDCPFAYVLISVSNIGAKIAVEQTMGRILRLPSATEKKNLELNYSFVYTSSENFSKSSSAIINGLEANGFSRADLKEHKGKIIADKTEYVMYIKDSSIKVPYMSAKSHQVPLAFNRDLIGSDFQVDELYKPFEIDFHDDQNQRMKIDIDEENGIYRVVQGELMLILYPEDFSLEEVKYWIMQNVRNTVISIHEMARYIDKALKDLSNQHTLEELSLNRFRLREKIQEEIQILIRQYAKLSFDKQLKKGNIGANSAFYTPTASILLARLSNEHFQKHLFERAGYLNGEETECAMRIDILENIEWWYRNREKEDFYLQGWRSGKFYPDFIVKTKGGKYILVEYKGEDRLSNDDTGYKVELGKLWEKLSSNSFYLVSRSNLDSQLKEIAGIK